MSIIEKEQFVVDGYQFATEKQARQAKKEVEGVRYTKENLDMSNPEEVLEVYNRILREKMFTTPIGYAFLRDLQEYLVASPVIRSKDIHPINFKPVIEKANEDDRLALQIKKREQKTRHKEEDRRKRERDRKKRTEQNALSKDYKVKFVNSLIVNMVLILVIIAMFVIVKMSDTPTIIDYENKLIDKYEKWESDLSKRENRIKEYEIKYNITDGY